MSNCFQDIIGIKGQCGAITEPSSGLYVNDLPYINLQVADALIEQDNISGVEFIQDKINYAVNAAKAELNSLMMPYYKKKTVLEQGLLGNYDEFTHTRTLVSAAKRRGIQIQINNYPYMEFLLTGISLWQTSITGNVTIKVHDLVTGKELDSFDVAVTANQANYVAINKKYLTNGQNFNILISYDATAIDSYQTTLARNQQWTGCSACGTGGYGSRYAVYNGAEIGTGSSVLYTNLSYPGFSSGLSIQYNIGCSTDGFMCSMKNQLAWAVLHKTGAEICREVVNGSKRVNSVTTIDKEKAAALMEDFETIYKGAIQDVFHNVAIPNDTCFQCNQKVKVISRIP